MFESKEIGHRTTSKRGFHRILACITLSVIACVSAAVGQGPLKRLLLNGKIASTRLKVIDGVAYVPVSDVAQALGQQTRSDIEGVEIYLPGGANQVQGLQGKLGEVLFDGAWRVQVNQISTADAYKERFTQNGAIEHTADANSKLVLVDLTVKNASHQQNFLNLRMDGQNVTALAGADGSSVKVYTYDVRTGSGGHFGGGGDWDFTSTMLPGSQAKFTAIFRAPRDFQPKDLIFTAAYPPKPFATLKYSNFRISVQQ